MQAPRDENRITSFLGTLNTDGVTPITLYADPTTHSFCLSNGSTGVSMGDGIAPRDENRIPVGLAINADDGVTPITIYIDGNHNLLTKST